MDSPYREENFEGKASNLRDCSGRMANTGLLVAKCGPCKNKKTVEGLIDASNKVWTGEFYLIQNLLNVIVLNPKANISITLNIVKLLDKIIN